MSAAQGAQTQRVLPGGYTIQRMIDRGVFAVVYEASTEAGQRVAIKLLDSNHPQALKRFRREIKVMQALPVSPYVVKFIAEGETEDGIPFIVMEYIVGFTLAKLLRSGRRLSEAAACKLMMELCLAFSGLHKLGLTHGDIKPANIMLYKGEVSPTAGGRRSRRWSGSDDVIHLGQVERSGLHMKLIDFGLARDAQGLLKLFEEEDFIPGHEFAEDLDAGMLAGTPEYISPEQITDAREEDIHVHRTDTPSDVFGLGIIFYELLSGQTPWPFVATATSARDYNLEVKRYLDSRASADYRLERLANTNHALWSVIAKTLDPDPKLRQGDAKAMWADIERYVECGAGVPMNLDQDQTILSYLDDIDVEKQAEEAKRQDPLIEAMSLAKGRGKAKARPKARPTPTHGKTKSVPNGDAVARPESVAVPVDAQMPLRQKVLWALLAVSIYLLLVNYGS